MAVNGQEKNKARRLRIGTWNGGDALLYKVVEAEFCYKVIFEQTPEKY